jgi:hypothetical protein
VDIAANRKSGARQTAAGALRAVLCTFYKRRTKSRPSSPGTTLRLGRGESGSAAPSRRLRGIGSPESPTSLGSDRAAVGDQHPSHAELLHESKELR